MWCEKPSFLLLGVHPTWWSHLQIDQADAEAGAVTAGLLGATSRPPLCGVYQGGLSPPLHGMSLGTPESMWVGRNLGHYWRPSGTIPIHFSLF